MDDIFSFNRQAWDKQVENGNPWTVPVSSEQVAAARNGAWQVVLTNLKFVPLDWFAIPRQPERTNLADLSGLDVLCLASGGGQQGPILAAAGANVTVFDASPAQLGRDRLVAERDHLTLNTLQGDMADLAVFGDASFDMVINPVSTCFVPDVGPIWRECGRVLRPGGVLLAGFVQPHNYCVDELDGRLYLRFRLPYSDVADLDPQERERRYGVDTPLEFSHTFTAQLGGMLAAGLAIVDLYEDINLNETQCEFMPRYMAVRAVKHRF